MGWGYHCPANNPTTGWLRLEHLQLDLSNLSQTPVQAVRSLTGHKKATQPDATNHPDTSPSYLLFQTLALVLASNLQDLNETNPD